MRAPDRAFTANDIKKRFTSRAYFDGHIVASESEYLMKPDLFTITRDFKANEYEIKVSLSDLRKELLYIETVMNDHADGLDLERDPLSLFQDEKLRRLNGERKVSTYDNKYRKHRLYLYGKEGDYYGGARPNRFYFLLPSHLFEAERARIDAIPHYGVIDAQSFFSLKRCRPLHRETIDPIAVWQAAHNIQGRCLNAHKVEVTT